MRKAVIRIVIVVAVVVVMTAAAYGVIILKDLSEKAQQTMEEVQETTEEVQKRLEPPKIINVRVETKTTRATISWDTTKSAFCELKVERLGMERFSGVSRGMRHSEIVLGLLPGKEYSFTIEAKSETGSDSYSETFKTEEIRKE